MSMSKSLIALALAAGSLAIVSPRHAAAQNCYICVNGQCGANVGGDPCDQSSMCVDGCFMSADCCGAVTWVEVPPSAGLVALAGSQDGAPEPSIFARVGATTLEWNEGVPVIADRAYPLATLEAYFVSADGAVFRQVRRPCNGDDPAIAAADS